MKILQIGKFYPPHHGGIETHLRTLCKELAKSVDIEVVVANTRNQTVEDVVDGIQVTRLANLGQVFAAPLCPSMVSAIRRSQADIVHIHLPNPVATLAYLLSGSDAKLVLSYHSDVVRQKFLARSFQPILDRALEVSSAIIVASTNYLDSSATLVHFRDRCQIIPYGIDPPAPRPVDPAAVEEIRGRYGPRMVLGVGRLVYYKGFEYLLAAMRLVRGHLVLVGDGPLRSTLERKVIEFGIGDRVTLTGAVEDVGPYYHAADVFVLPSIARSEAFGLVQLEAMACGKPVINTQLDSGVPFVSPDGETGITVPPADPGSLSRAINHLLDRPSLCVEYGKAGRLRVECEFSTAVMTGRTMDLYKQVTSCAPVTESAKPLKVGQSA